ncbi:entericidin A/B family lipoprotein [Sphingomonas sp. LaA6.9]|nr:entericidin A/B family lipoprotein [Sphingomonas sp. LaA6.9]MCJ8155948.1 entericidin A/B family lipoprotein [Sphingomonas sp. LaA6.9]
MKKSVAIAILALTAVTLSACSTVKGLGRDIESVGQAGEEAIN